MEWRKLLDLPKLLKSWSGRPGSNRRRPAWEAGILPLNYSRLPYFSSTYLFSKHLGRSTASLFRLLRPSKTMGFDRKMDSKVDSKPVWEASPPPFSFTVRFTVHPTTDSTYHTVRPLGRRQTTETRPPAGPDVQGIPITQERNGDWRGGGRTCLWRIHPSITLREKTKCPGMRSCG